VDGTRGLKGSKVSCLVGLIDGVPDYNFGMNIGYDFMIVWLAMIMFD
jgi:hypothetical protein